MKVSFFVCCLAWLSFFLGYWYSFIFEKWGAPSYILIIGSMLIAIFAGAAMVDNKK